MTLIAGIGFLFGVLFFGACLWPYEPDLYTGAHLWVQRGNGTLQMSRIVRYDPRTRTATIDGWTNMPNAGDTFTLR